MEEPKRKSRREGSEKEETTKRSNRDRDSREDRDREKDKSGRDRSRVSRHERDKSVDDGKHKDGEKHRERERDRHREKDRDRDDERVREKSKGRDKDRDREDREREKERERKERSRHREREKRRDRSYSSDEEEVLKEKEKKRRRREEDNQARDVERSSKQDRHREKSQEISRKGDEELGAGKEKTREEDMEEEQKRLDDEMEKRRKRVQEWQELRRKEESEREKVDADDNRDGLKSGKAWTLEGEESDEDEADPDGKSAMDVDEDGVVNANGHGGNHGGNDMSVDNVNEATPALPNGVDHAAEDDEIDPLDAFMNSVVLPEVENLNSKAVVAATDSVAELADKNGKATLQQSKKGTKKSMGRIMQGEDSDSDYEDPEDEENTLEDEDDEEFMKRVKKTKVEKLSIVDHSKMDYPYFRKDFYTEVKEVARMTPKEVADYRDELELKIRGKDVPKPIKTWHQTGLSTKILDTIKKLNYEKPMSIQAQALPVIMSGRDCIGIAKTGSGKTLAFVLPMLRHIKDQPPLMSGDGPIGLIMAPTRELVQQIYSDIRKFTKVLGLTCVPVYGGSGVAQQISDLKRGAEIVVCTPGRMIDILCTSAGKITNLRRVTYLVMDEADRMFDMGFEPQITRIVQNIQPGRQTVLFSATFPRQVEILAQKVLNKPVGIQVGGRSVVNKDITQLVEVRPESDRFLRLLELLGEWYEKGKVLIFVHSQEKCDALFKDLLKAGYPCLSLHGAKDQTDRESTLADFKSNVCNLLIATSIAARGLDVKDLELVINFDVPNHYEDYVHRVGRTGRAGKKGCAITFVSEDDARYAPDLVKALELSEQSVPADLKALADGFMAKVNQGVEHRPGTGYGGSGFKFNEEEDEVRKAAKKAQAKGYGFEEDKSDSEDEDDVKRVNNDTSRTAQIMPNPLPVLVDPSNDAAARAAQAAYNLQRNIAKIIVDAMPEHYEAELEINDFPQNARWKVTHKETLGPISDFTGAAITTRGQFYPPGKVPGPTDRKLYLFIEGPTEQSVKHAKQHLKHAKHPGSAPTGRYTVG